MKKKIYIGLIMALSLFLSGCASQNKSEEKVYNDTLFDTVIQVKIYDNVDNRILEGCEKLCKKYDLLLSKTNKESDISKINQACGIPVTVSDETVSLIQKGMEYGDLSEGAFDITINSISSLWDFHSESGKIPSEQEINTNLPHVNYKNISITENQVTLSDEHASIDLGGIAKGYIADKLAEYLKDNGVRHAIINLGGNILTVGSKPDGSDYNIGIKDPSNPDGSPITCVKTSDKSVVTTGIYERFFEKDGIVYHHILDPKTGYPCDNTLASVTIITDSSADADALSTTCYLLGLEKGMKLIRSMENMDAIFITKDNEIIDSRDL